jgi:Zn-dependent peptidase ImmA (M78 family)/transcriptional regulator with XRE-family HTH domain
VRQVFAPARLTLAREFKGWTKEELGRRARVTGAAIGQFERGTSTPNVATLDDLAEALDVPVGFFRTGADSGSDASAYFRSLRTTTLTERRKARAFAQYVHQLVGALEHHVRLPDCTVVAHPAEADSNDLDEIEHIAAATRRAWDLPRSSPLPNVVKLLEAHGVVVVRNYRGSSKVDAFSVPFSDRPVVVLSSEKGKHDRSRFDAVHELGHLVMHSRMTDDTKLIEAQAHRFAGAFLMPAEGIRDELPATARDVRHLIELKQKWGTSIAAILRRARDLRRMAPDDYTNAMKAISARGWRRDEPGSVKPEEPMLLRRAVETAAAAGVDIEELAETANLSPDFISSVVQNAMDQRRAVQL